MLKQYYKIDGNVMKIYMPIYDHITEYVNSSEVYSLFLLDLCRVGHHGSGQMRLCVSLMEGSHTIKVSLE